MIPKNIKRQHILKAIKEIDNKRVKKRSSIRFFLEYNGNYYPPKYVISLANKYANGKELNSNLFSGGYKTNSFLKKLGFKIVEKSNIKKDIKQTANLNKSLNKSKEGSQKNHNERCPKCKETIKVLLKKIYGDVKVNYKFNNIGTSPEDFKDSRYYPIIKKIYKTLQNHRGFKKFVKAKTLPNCDFFIPNLGFILEFDESQHFTLPRRLTLEKYPKDLKTGFNIKRWMKLSKEINAKDNDPHYRDEQRAWYDTLRDVLPEILGLKPTVRLFAKDFVWCSLDPNDPKDIDKFKKIIETNNKERVINIREEENPIFARIIIAKERKGKAQDAKVLLEKIYERWPNNKKVKFIITPGGFIHFNWPKKIYNFNNKHINNDTINILIKEAKKTITSILTKDILEKSERKTDYITIGIDSYKEINNSINYSQPHIELVFLIDIRNKKFYWTGKSYPTPNQQKGLVRITNLESHFFDLDIGKVMILGCHDLTIFNPRSKNAKGWRKEINEEFKRIAQKKKPKIVLQHPHTTIKVRTWLNAWHNLSKLLSSVKIYASAGRFYESNRQPDELIDVLKYTKKGKSIDFIVK